MYTLYMIVCLVISLPKLPYTRCFPCQQNSVTGDSPAKNTDMHRISMVLANPTRLSCVHVATGPSYYLLYTQERLILTYTSLNA